MKRKIVVLLLALVAGVTLGENSHRLATYNVRYVHPKNGDTGEKAWPQRRAAVLSTVLDNHIDIVGMQEVTGNNHDSVTGNSQLQDLCDGLAGYTCIAYERADKDYSYNVVFYKSNRYRCLSHSAFWLSETPEVCSVGFTAGRERRCVMCHMQDIATGKTFWFCVTHPESGNAVAGEQSADLIVKYLRDMTGDEPVFLTGDLNHKRTETAIRNRYLSLLQDAADFVPTDSNYCIPRDGAQTACTYQHWRPAKENKGAEIDFLLYRHMTPLNRHIVTEQYGRSLPPSDHFLLYGDFLLGDPVDPWVLEAARPDTGAYYGITSANGQIGLVSSRTPLRLSNLVIGGLYDQYGKEGINSFFPNLRPLCPQVRVNGVEVTDATVSEHHQFFDMRTATLTGTFVCNGVKLTYRILALRHLPYCFMMEVEAPDGVQLELQNRHELPEWMTEAQNHTKHIREKANPYVEHYPEYDLLTTIGQSPTGKWTLAASTTTIQEGNRYTIVGAVMDSHCVPDAPFEAERLAVFARKEGRDRLLEKHHQAWETLWQNDIEIEGDPVAQQDVHQMLYHLYAFNREGSSLSCSPMGLSGLGYSGHAFWDADTWMFPALCVLQPDLARQMVDYRYQRLEMAKKKAYLYGYKGALFPWQSADSGQEETAPHNMYPIAEHHISGDVAIAAWQYYQLTGDKEWLRTHGWPLLLETARFWESRIEQDSTGRYVLRNVIGADEWGQNAEGGKLVDNNAYTIGVCKRNLQYATKAARVLHEKAPKRWSQLADGLRWELMDNGCISLHDGYHGEISKQADVALLAYPLELLTDTAAIRKNMEYYIATVPRKRTPAMSKSIYAILYSRLGDREKALYYFRDSYVPNLNPPFRVMAEFDGGTNPYFLTGAGGTLQTLLFGFGGLRLTDKGLRKTANTLLPDGWTKMSIIRNGERYTITK